MKPIYDINQVNKQFVVASQPNYILIDKVSSKPITYNPHQETFTCTSLSMLKIWDIQIFKELDLWLDKKQLKSNPHIESIKLQQIPKTS